MTKKLEIVINGRAERTWFFLDNIDMSLVERDIAEFVENHIESETIKAFIWRSSRHD